MENVTAIITCFNQGHIIEETINSLLNQNYKNLDILVVDDGSDDDSTKDFLANYKNERVRIISKENGHVSSARNYGISMCANEYLFISDGDDTYSEDLISSLVSEMNKDVKTGIASSWIKTFGLEEWIVKPEGGNIQNFLHKNNCPG